MKKSFILTGTILTLLILLAGCIQQEEIQGTTIYKEGTVTGQQYNKPFIGIHSVDVFYDDGTTLHIDNGMRNITLDSFYNFIQQNLGKTIGIAYDTYRENTVYLVKIIE